jgi:hypothetical protein
MGDDHGHEFDFWIGEWDVLGADGAHLGVNSIRPLFDTGALAEHWRSDSGIEGHSLNCFDPDRHCWHQTWVDSAGGMLQLDGGLRDDGAMVMEGLSEGERQRITWRPEGEEVRQVWETSADDGQTWTLAFDGRYVRS